MIDAGKRNKVVIQVGTQSRSTKTVQEAMDRIHGGAIGEILVAKAWNSQQRRNLGHVKPTQAASVPRLRHSGSGPRPRRRSTPIASTVRGGSSATTAPATSATTASTTSTSASGAWGSRRSPTASRRSAASTSSTTTRSGRTRSTSSATTTPATAASGRGSSSSNSASGRPTSRRTTRTAAPSTARRGCSSSATSVGWKLYGERNKLVEQMKGRVTSAGAPPELHRRGSCKGDKPPAPAEVGHISAGICHLANISTRLRQTIEFDPRGETDHQQRGSQRSREARSTGRITGRFRRGFDPSRSFSR